jgi:two-component system CheB/CheR fusion protein
MNEELQSSNEELQTMNDELRQRTDDLNQSSAFLESVLASLHAGAIAIDRNFTILMWNHEASALWGLRPEEVCGRSLLSLDTGLPVEKLRAPVRALLTGESTYEELVLAATNRRGKVLQCRITCSQLLGTEHTVQGVILLMEEWGRSPNA